MPKGDGWGGGGISAATPLGRDFFTRDALSVVGVINAFHSLKEWYVCYTRIIISKVAQLNQKDKITLQTI